MKLLVAAAALLVTGAPPAAAPEPNSRAAPAAPAPDFADPMNVLRERPGCRSVLRQVKEQSKRPDVRRGEARTEPAPPPPPAAPGFAPNVIRGNFAAALTGVTRAANEVAAVQLPLYGRIAAGLPIEALRDQGSSVEVPAALLAAGEHYALEVSGDSMVEAGILDGDTVIIRRGETAENGAIVVALVDDAEVTLKRLRRKGNSIALEPANRAYETRIFGPDRVRVQGRLIGLLRKY